MQKAQKACITQWLVCLKLIIFRVRHNWNVASVTEMKLSRLHTIHAWWCLVMNSPSIKKPKNAKGSCLRKKISRSWKAMHVDFKFFKKLESNACRSQDFPTLQNQFAWFFEKCSEKRWQLWWYICRSASHHLEALWKVTKVYGWHSWVLKKTTFQRY